MTAKHKRPFYVFAAVALLCCMVLAAGVRGSRADDGRGPLLAAPSISDAAPTLTPSPAAPGTISPGGVPTTRGGTGSGTPGGPDGDPTVPDSGGAPVHAGPDDDGLPAPQSGMVTLPPPHLSGLPVTDPGLTPPVADEARPRGRGHKSGKGKDKVKQGHGTPPDTGPDTGPDTEPDTEPAPGTESPSEAGVETESVEPGD